MNKYHEFLLNKIKENAGKGTKHSLLPNYLGHAEFSYKISNPNLRLIIKEFLALNKDLTSKEFIDLLDSLYNGSSYEEKHVAGMLIGYMKKLRSSIKPKMLDKWLNNLQGWALIDSLCQSSFDYNDLLDNWESWEKRIRAFNKSKNISKRRASLVLLTGVVVKSEDTKLSELAFQMIDNLRTEKDILISKAVSWLLRDLVKLHKSEVSEYIKLNKDVLPNFVIKEVNNKILTGRKTAKP